MDLKRWEKRVYTIDYRTETEEEAEYIIEWLLDRPKIAATAIMSGEVFTFKATNKDIVLFSTDIADYHLMNTELEEMEEYYNEH